MALIVTVVLMLILAGITVSIMNADSGLFNKASESVFATQMKSYADEVQVYKSNHLLSGNYNTNISVGLTGQESIKTVIPDITADYEREVIVQNGEMYYYYIGTEKSQERVKWCFKHKIKVWGYDSYNDFLNEIGTPEPIPVPDSEYKNIGKIYMHSPDISKFNPRNTFYVTYDENGDNEKVAGRIDQIEEPANWYDYEKKQWANIVTVNGNEMSYWVWIPRYVYKLDQENEFVDVKFVENNTNSCIILDANNNQTTVDTTEYLLPEAFTFAGKSLNGFWLSKYELSEGAEVDNAIYYGTSVNTITVNAAKTTEEYKVYLDGVNKYTGVLPCTLTGLQGNKEYNIYVTLNDQIVSNDFVTTRTNAPIDLSGFNPKCTFYVYWDEEGNEHSDIPISEPAPENWYNYSEKRWANIVTVNNNSVAYWVWIPRYEYRAYYVQEVVNARFIDAEKTVPSLGYAIPEAFTFAGKNLPGYWLSKYELAEGLERTDVITYGASVNMITVNSPNKTAEYEVYLDGTSIYTGTLPYTISGLQENREYNIWVSQDNMMLTSDYVKTQAIEVDLSGFNPACTFYVYWDEDGTEHSDIPISQPAPANWYNYSEKRWANIVTKGLDSEGNAANILAYWVYIPRYQYKLYQTPQIVDAKFISRNKVEADPGYAIPEAFTFAGKDLPGYWLSKYELSE